jgi:peptidase E
MIHFMTATEPTIIATSMGFDRGDRPDEVSPGPIFDLAADLAGAPARPRLSFLVTAVGDDIRYRSLIYEAFAGTRFDVTHLALFPMPNVPDIREYLLAQDVVWVGGGSVANLLAVWRVHNLDTIFREAWEAGVVLGGVSAGSICWHEGGTTDSFGPDLRAVTNGLAYLPYGNGVHYDSEEQRRPLLHKLVGDGTLPVSHATDDGVGLVYRGTELAEVVTDQSGKYGYRVEPGAPGEAVETPLEPRYLR